MSNSSIMGMTPWVDLAVQAVGPKGDRAHDVWLAEVERTAVDLWLMSAPGGSTALQAEALSSCVPVSGMLTQAHVDGGQRRARLVLHLPVEGGGAPAEHVFHTEEFRHRRARQVLERAQSLIGCGVRLLLSPGSGGGDQRVLHISDSGERAPEAAPHGEQGQRADRRAAAERPAAPESPGPEPVAPQPVAPLPVAEPAATAAAPAPSAPAPAPEQPAGGLTWEQGSVSVWRNIDRSWPKGYRTSCLLSLRERVRVDDAGLVQNLDQLIELAHQLPDPDTPRGKDIAARFPA
ncbi:hypothetical protein ACFV6E_38885 [Streptomyces sp. NPDC059785]|uniref:hypothetical protein n=1 Tax=unclassified Streptomyces TaxID=2593676 RepID=UPI00365C4699